MRRKIKSVALETGNVLQLGENLNRKKLKTRQILGVHLDFGRDHLEEKANPADYWGRRTVKLKG